MNGCPNASPSQVVSPAVDDQLLQRRQARAFAHAAIGMALLDQEGRWVDVNDEFCRMLGMQREGLLRQSFESLTVQEDLVASRLAMRRLIKGEIESCDLEKRYRRGDGQIIWVRIHAAMIPAEQGEAAILITQAREITQERQTREALAESEARLSLALAGADLGMWHWHLKGDHFEFNQGARDLLGYESGEALPDFNSTKALLHPDDRTGVSAVLRRHLAGDEPDIDRVVRLRRHSGDYMWTLIRGRITHRNRSGRPLRVSGTLMDVSKWKELEHRLRQMATTDALTGLLNRRAGVEALDRELSGSERKATPLSMVLLDVDHFKQINDELGHDVGDHVLELLGGYLEANRRAGDHAIRWGGEEFAIVLPATDQPGAEAQARRLFKGIDGLAGQIQALNGLSASMGVVTRRPDESARELMKRADALMYQAKQEGRACIRSD